MNNTTESTNEVPERGRPRTRNVVRILGGLVALALVVVGGFYGATALFGGSDSLPDAAETAPVTLQEPSGSREVAIIGRLDFPLREELSFDGSGEVGEILTAPGQQVTPGQALARLDATTIAALSQALAQARLDLDAAEDALDEAREAFVNSPLEQAKFQEKIAKAQLALEDAKEARDDVQLDHEQALAAARQTEAKAQVALEDAEETLGDFERDHQKSLAAALSAHAAAEITLDQAQEKLNDFELDESQELAQARKVKSAAEVVLDAAQDGLQDFIIDYDQELAAAQKRVADAEVGLEVAEDVLTDYLVNPTVDVERVRYEELLSRLEVAVAVAQSEMSRSDTGLARIVGGPDSLKRQELETAVDLAQTTLALAQADVAELGEGLDLLELQQREAAVQTAEAALSQTAEDLSEEQAGPDASKRAALVAARELAQAKLAQAVEDLAEEVAGPDPEELAVREKLIDKKREELTELIDGPDPFVVALREAEVASAQVEVDDALEDLAGTTIQAPFAGVVSLVNAEVEDLVDKESRVIEVIDPSRVELAGRVDAVDRELVALGDRVAVDLASLPDHQLTGAVIWIAEQPSTERGVVSYNLRVSIELPPGVEIPVELSSVSGRVLPRQ